MGKGEKSVDTSIKEIYNKKDGNNSNLLKLDALGELVADLKRSHICFNL